MGARLERAEEFIGAGNARTRIPETHEYEIALGFGGNSNLPDRAVLQSAEAVAREIDEDLEQAVVVGLNEREIFADVPGNGNTGVAKGRLHYDARLIEYRSK